MPATDLVETDERTFGSFARTLTRIPKPAELEPHRVEIGTKAGS